MAKKKGDEPESKTDLLEGEGPGVGPQKKIPAIEKAARKYVECRDARMKLTEDEVSTKAVLMAAMKEAKVDKYRYDGMDVTLTAKENVRVRSVDSDTDIDDD